jgi:hypothetical protein
MPIYSHSTFFHVIVKLHCTACNYLKDEKFVTFDFGLVLIYYLDLTLQYLLFLHFLHLQPQQQRQKQQQRQQIKNEKRTIPTRTITTYDVTWILHSKTPWSRGNSSATPKKNNETLWKLKPFMIICMSLPLDI